jgi:uncharacterized membrane protein
MGENEANNELVEKGDERHEGGAQSISAVIQSLNFSGPLPPPILLRQYDEVVPGAAERIIKMAEEQAAHRQRLERQVVSTDNIKSVLGTILAFVVAIVGLGCSFWAAINGHPEFGTVLGVGTLASLVYTFVYGTNIKHASVTEKKREKRRPLDKMPNTSHNIYFAK